MSLDNAEQTAILYPVTSHREGLPLDEAELVRRAKAGEPEALSEFYEQYVDRVFRYIVIRVGNHHDSEDLTEEVFLRALQSISKFNYKGAPLAAWLFRIAHNIIVDHWRRTRGREMNSLDDAMEVSEPGADPEEGLELFSDTQGLRKAMEGLTERQREVLTLRFGADLSIVETAKVMGRKEGTIKALQHNALAALRRLVDREGTLKYDHEG